MKIKNEIRINPHIKVIRTGENSLLLKSLNGKQLIKSEKQIELIELILANINDWTKLNELRIKYLERENAIFENMLFKLEGLNFIQYKGLEDFAKGKNLDL